MMTMTSRGHDPFLSVEDDDDNFFESCERMSTAVPVNLDSIEYEDDDDDDDDYDDSRVSFSSAIGGPAPSSSDCRFSTVSMADLGAEEEYNVWMAEPISIEERRRRLLAGMGLSKELVQVDGADFSKLKSARVRSESGAAAAAATATPAPPAPAPAPTAEATTTAMTAAAAVVATRGAAREEIITSSSAESVLTRSRSDGSVVFPLAAERSGSAVTLRRSKSAPSALCGFRRQEATSGDSQIGSGMMGVRDGEASETGDGVFKIKDLNTGKEFVINELREDGSLNRLRDPETGKQLTMEEFEKCVGHSPIVKELMRRVNSEKQAEGGGGGGGRAPSMAGKSTKKRSWLKNIRGVANSVSELIGEWEKDNPLLGRSGRHATACAPNDWMKVHHHGKSYKEFTGLYMCQEIQAHKGSIWTIRFSSNAEYLASAGEDRVIHVWQVFDSDDLPSVISEELTSPLQSPMRGSHSMDRPPIPPLPADAHIWERKKRGKLSGSGRRGVRENVQVPSTMFSLSDKPICSFEGHQDDVLDLSWSKSQQLLSSSMDKTVRLWDMETKTCLKLFAHNDYVTCIQFNPIDDQYFISGSLDAKVRIWSIPDRQVVDWTDLHEMVTAACYTPDGKGALVGSHKGSCRFYDTSDYKLNQTAQIDIQPKKKKSSPKKMTGFQFSPAKPSEVLVTSADSQIRVFDGVDLIHKFRGFKNTSSQISASFSHDGRYVVCASEDSQVYIWKREEYRNVGGGKRKGFITTRSHEHFHCKDVSVAIPWPGSNKYEPPLVPIGSRRQSQQQSSKNMNIQQGGTPGVSSSEYASLSGSNRGHGPPLPRKSFLERTSPSPEEELAKPSRTDSRISSTSSSANGSSGRLLGFSSSSSTSSGSSSSVSSPWRWYDASSTLSGGVQAATAWGLAFVTAGLGGELKTYQNFGLPVRLSRQTILKANTGF